MKKILVILSILAVLLVAGCTSTASTSSKSIIGNQQLLSNLSAIEDMASNNKTTPEMLENFKAQLKGDKIAEDFMDEAIWLTRFGEFEHSQHSLSFLQIYIKGGEQLLCPGHEIEHIELFVKHSNFELLNGTVQGLEENYPVWKQQVYMKREKYPAFYKNIDNLSATIEESMQKIKSGDYNISSETEFLQTNEICVTI